jgi:hypothetical protein
VEATTNIHQGIESIVGKTGASVAENTASFHATVNVLDPNPATRNIAIRLFLHLTQLLTAGFFLRLDDVDVVQFETLKAEILQQLAVLRQRIRGSIGDALIVKRTGHSSTQKNDAERSIYKQEVLDTLTFFFPL